MSVCVEEANGGGKGRSDHNGVNEAATAIWEELGLVLVKPLICVRN